MPQDARFGFPFTSETAKYLWVTYSPGVVPPFKYDVPAQHDTLAVYRQAYEQWQALAARRGFTAPVEGFQRGLQVLEVWQRTRAEVGAGVATTALKTLSGTLFAAKEAAGNAAMYQTEWRTLLVATSQIVESLVTSLEWSTAPRPDLAKALWNLAKVVPLGEGARTTGDVAAWWQEKVKELKKESGGYRPEVAQKPLELAEAVGRTLSDVHAVIGQPSSDTLVPSVLRLTDQVRDLSPALRGALPSLRDALGSALASVMTETWTRLDHGYQQMIRQDTGRIVFRGTVAAGGHRAAPPSAPATLYTVDPEPRPGTEPKPIIPRGPGGREVGV